VTLSTAHVLTSGRGSSTSSSGRGTAERFRVAPVLPRRPEHRLGISYGQMAIGRRKDSALLILSCSKRKRQVIGALPCVEMYDGPAFRSLRRWLRDPNRSRRLDIVVLSGKDGFVSGARRLRPYDHRMLGTEAAMHRRRYENQFRRLVSGHLYNDVFVNLGAAYMRVLPCLREVLNGKPRVTYAHGRIGVRLQQQKRWLESIR
jgi:hypothetical protein